MRSVNSMRLTMAALGGEPRLDNGDPELRTARTGSIHGDVRTQSGVIRREKVW